MRVFGQFLLAVVAFATISNPKVPVVAQAPARDAATVLAEAREALGGEKRLSAVKNFVVTGRTRQVRGDNLVPIEFEIAVELPDKYVRKDEVPAQESGPTSSGFNGDALIQVPAPPPPPSPAAGRAGGPAAPTAEQLEAGRKARAIAVKQDFARVTLGMFAGSFSSYPLTFTYVGQAEAPQGKADVVEAKAPNLTVRLFVNSQTHLPIMVSWQPPARPAGPGRGGMPPPGGTTPPASTGAGSGERVLPAPATAPPGGAAAAPPSPAPRPATGQPPGAGEPAAQGTPPPLPMPGQAGRAGGGPPAAPVEFRLYFADYRDVGGLQWPFRLRKATGTETTEETTFDRFRVNTKIDPRKFEVRQ